MAHSNDFPYLVKSSGYNMRQLHEQFYVCLSEMQQANQTLKSILGLALKSVLNLNNYLSAFWYFLVLGEGLGLFDLLVIDLLWWRSPKLRLRQTRFFNCPCVCPEDTAGRC